MLVLVAAMPAHADGPDNLGAAVGGLAVLGELAVPDLRIEQGLTSDDRGWVLAWPLPLRVDTVSLRGAHLALAHTLEYQLALGRSVHRGLAVERASLLPAESGARSRWSPIVEVGGVLGEDGAGLVLGLGVGRAVRLGDEGALTALASIVRFVWTNADARVDLSVDLLQLPLSSLGR